MKERIDSLLVEKGFIESREKAKRAIMAGLVFVNGQRVDKPGTKIDVENEITVKGKAIPYVSRGGLKLEKTIKTLELDLNDLICADIGASTGGFTDCMLQHGAKKVYSIDVGYGQLDWKLRNDDRVINMERTNVRYVELEHINNENLDFASIDVSFISLRLVLPVVKKLLKEELQLVYLIKPQFEAGREQVKKNGVVRDIKVHEKVMNEVLSFSQNIGIYPQYITFSPITGPKGNIEFLAYCTNKPKYKADELSQVVEEVVKNAHFELKSK